MLPSSLLLLTLAILASASSPSSPLQSYSPSLDMIETTSFFSSYSAFCSRDTISNSSESAMDLTYIVKDSGCQKNDCLKSFEDLLHTCTSPPSPYPLQHQN